jgi:hypothetical protein
MGSEPLRAHDDVRVFGAGGRGNPPAPSQLDDVGLPLVVSSGCTGWAMLGPTISDMNVQA